MSIWPFKSRQPVAVPVEPQVSKTTTIEEEEPTGTLTINALTYDESEERIRVEMDWDDDFVLYLKRHGFTGSTDEIIVHKYVATLYRNVMEDLNREGKNFE